MKSDVFFLPRNQSSHERAKAITSLRIHLTIPVHPINIQHQHLMSTFNINVIINVNVNIIINVNIEHQHQH